MVHFALVSIALSLTAVAQICRAEPLYLQAEKCKFAPGTVPENHQAQLHCCNVTDEWMRINWRYGAMYLTTHLLTLRSWRCPQFESECRRPTFAFNLFSQRVYQYFCNRTSFESSCRGEIASLVPKTPEQRSWGDLAMRLDSRALTVDQLLLPCTQVALFHKENAQPKFGKFHEAVAIKLPFCELNWCGTDDYSYSRGVISVWNCMSTRCRANIVIIFVVFVLLSFAVITANATVIAVFKRNAKLRNSQAVYKASLALADLIVGAVVIPTFISTLGVLAWPPVEAAVDEEVRGYFAANGSIEENASRLVLVRKPTGDFARHVTFAYMDFVGFFTLTSLSVSAYTLMIASIDRFKAVFKPLKYNHAEAKKLARVLSFVVWVVSLLFASLPLYVPGMNYSLVASILFSSSGSEEVVILYAVAIILPLLVVWSSTVATYLMAKRHARARKHISARSRRRNENLEHRLAKTLAVMVATFSACLLPSVVVLASSLGFSNIRFSYPEELDLVSGLAFSSAEFVAIVILASNSLWNVFIYSARNKEFRAEAQGMYSQLASALGISQCFGFCRDKIAFYFYSTRRRFSNLRRESQPTTGSSTKFSGLSSDKSSASTGPNVSSDSQTAKTVKISEHSSSVQDVNGNVRSQGAEKEKEMDDEKMMKDSVFDSYVVDVHADRLFVSTMEGILEEREDQV